MQINIPQELKEVMKIITDSSYEIYLVGGAVRDSIIGKDNDDYDLCTNMPLEEIKKIFPSFVIMNENDHRKTGTIRVGDKVLEISSFRGNSLKEDLSNRDLTVNAIACDKEGNIVDPLNGVNDIISRKISIVNKEGLGIVNDPLRIMRIIRFSSTLNYDIDDVTKEQMNEKKYLLKFSAKERIYKELCKILVSENASKVLRENKEIICEIIPELKETIGFDQHNDYHIYDVFEHTLKVIDNTPPILPLRLAALFHDIGKPLVFTRGEDGVGHFFGHQEESTKIFERFANEYRVDNKTKEIVEKLIWYHDRELSTKSSKINKFLMDYGVKNLDLLFLLKEADIKAQNPKYINRLDIINSLRNIYYKRIEENPCLSIRDLKINGKTLIKMGFYDKQIGIILKELLDKVSNEMIINEEESLEDYVTSHYN